MAESYRIFSADGGVLLNNLRLRQITSLTNTRMLADLFRAKPAYGHIFPSPRP